MELLAPCGSPLHLEEAIRSGADACYFGASHFSARAHAQNFSLLEAKEGIAYAHAHGVKMYVAMNTLVFNDELQAATELCSQLGAWGVDAFIVQDLGIAKMLRQAMPTIPLHASTQMVTRHPAGAQTLRELGFRRAVLARETALSEMPALAKEGLELEVFVHGAQCVSYSGLCFFSAFHGGRSGNRGDCAQPCRRFYKLYENDTMKAQGHLLSPRDMDLLHLLPELEAAKVTSLKIEGRMKSPAYLAVTCRAYRQALDALAAGQALHRSEIEALQQDMARVFNRGGSFSQGYALGNPGADNIFSKSPKNIGLEVAKLVGIDGSSFLIEALMPLAQGDGYALYDEDFQVLSSGYLQHMTAEDGSRLPQVEAGQRVWIKGKGSLEGARYFFRSFDKDFEKALQNEPDEKSRKRLDFYLEARLDQALRLTVLDEDYQMVLVESDYHVEPAKKQASSIDGVRKQLDRLGDSPYRLGHVEIAMDKGIFIPTSRLNELRRQGLERYKECYEVSAQIEPQNRRPSEEYTESIYQFLDRIPPPVRYPKETLISVEVNRFDQALMAIDVGCHELMLDLTSYRGQPSISQNDLQQLVHEASLADVALGLTYFPIRDAASNQAFLRALESGRKAGIDLLGVKNLSFIPAGRSLGYRLQAEASLNATNDAAISSLVDLDFESVIVSNEMAISDMAKLSYIGNIRLGAVIYGDLPLMTSAYCPAGAFCGGRSYDRACTAPCQQHSYHLVNDAGQSFSLKEDDFCRACLYDARVLDGLPHLEAIDDANLDQWRLSMLCHEPELLGKRLERLWTVLEGGPLSPLADNEAMPGFFIEGVTRCHDA